MRFCLHLATGLGLALLQTTSAAALQHRTRDHALPHQSARHHALRHDGTRDASAAHRARHRRVHRKDEGERDDAQSLRGLKREVRDLRQQLDELESVRQELTEFKQKIWGSAPFSLSLVTQPLVTQPLVAKPLGAEPFATEPAAGEPDGSAPAGCKSAGLTDLGGGTMPLPDAREPRPNAPPRPGDPLQASLPAAIDDRALERLQRSAVEEAKAYLLETAHPGDSMVRQGPSLAIERLHPALIVKLAAAIKRARAAGLREAGIFSAYRPPGFHIGGFQDKFKSLHSYGLAADMSGIGHAGSASARLWKTIAEESGLYLPYGAANHAEFNHTQLIPAKVAPDGLHATIAAAGPTDLRRMWLASGIDDYVTDVRLTQLAAAAATPAAGEESAADRHLAARPVHKAGKRKAAEGARAESGKPARRAAAKAGKERNVQRNVQRAAQRSAEREHRGKDTHRQVRSASHDGKAHARRKKGQA